MAIKSKLKNNKAEYQVVKAYPIICEPKEILSGVFYRILQLTFIQEAFTSAVIVSQFLCSRQFLQEENCVTTDPFEQFIGKICFKTKPQLHGEILKGLL